ncbi:MAG: A/G-specific adenine glycosylase [Clostridia bacterium]|nr:A/G-specific adenine glycosylase [Clostridia bacterium]
MQSFALLPRALPPWFRENARQLPWRQDRDPYRVLVSEIMLQQTRVEAVIGYYTRFLEAFPTVEALAAAPEDRLFKLWEGLGYYSRARNLQKAAQAIVRAGAFPSDLRSVRALSGVGPYTAGAICSICFDLPTSAVDGNVLRVAARYTNDATPVDLPAFRRSVAERLEAVYPSGACGEFTQALMELGATVCTPRSPKCADCPLREKCEGFAAGTAAALPVKSPKKEKRLVRKTVFLLWHGDEMALVRRKDSGLLAGMWSFPDVDEPLDAEGALRWAERAGVQPAALLEQTHRTHVFTHIRWEMDAFTILCGAETDAFVWRTPGEIRRSFALPTAFRIFLKETDV